MSKTVWNIIIVVVVAAGLFLGYNFFFAGGDDEALLTSTRTTGGDEQAAGEFFTLLRTLERLSIDTTLLETDIFQALRDFSVSLPVAEPGRTNPFAPFQ